MFNLMLTGIGGQGTILAARLLAGAALASGLDVRGSETIGMAQRGGSVVSHLRFGQNIHSPLIPFGLADMLIAFDETEGFRTKHYLCENGILIYDKKPKAVAHLNTYLLGRAVSTGKLPFDADILERVIRSNVTAKHLDANISSFFMGCSIERQNENE